MCYNNRHTIWKGGGKMRNVFRFVVFTLLGILVLGVGGYYLCYWVNIGTDKALDFYSSVYYFIKTNYIPIAWVVGLILVSYLFAELMASAVRSRKRKRQAAQDTDEGEDADEEDA